MDWNIIKGKIAACAVEELSSGSKIIGLGSGSTSQCFIKALSEVFKERSLPIQCVATSKESEDYAHSLGLPIIAPFDWKDPVDITFDGADAVDEEGTAIKGAGGAHLREKIVAFSSKRLVLLIDERKWKRPWHEIPLPIEALRFGIENTLRAIRSLGFSASIRSGLNTADNNRVIDVKLTPETSLLELERRLRHIPGIVETGLFYHFASEIIIGYGNGRIEKRQVHNDSRFRPSIV